MGKKPTRKVNHHSPAYPDLQSEPSKEGYYKYGLCKRPWLHQVRRLSILLNLAFSLQAAYAAPLILLAQTRQADRDKAHADADAQHREALATAAEQRQAVAAQQSEQIMALLQQNVKLTELITALSQRIETLTVEVHSKVVQGGTNK